jgi:LmbE family N-acetylglucosaminyl deacetylase
MPTDRPTDRPGLPPWKRPLAVVAHPDDESFGLGAVLTAFIDAGAVPAVLCLTHGEASTLHGVEGDLAPIRAGELAEAARRLGIEQVTLCDFPDGALRDAEHAALHAEVTAAVTAHAADGLLVFDRGGVTGHPDHDAATELAVEAAGPSGLPVLAWTLPLDVATTLGQETGTTFVGRGPELVDVVLTVHRDRQRHAVQAHPSQAVPGSVLWRRLVLLGDKEHLRWLSPG